MGFFDIFKSADVRKAERFEKIRKKIIIKEQKEECPLATQDIELNIKNRQHAIDEYGYGPPNPEESNNEFWSKKADMWNVDVEKTKIKLIFLKYKLSITKFINGQLIL